MIFWKSQLLLSYGLKSQIGSGRGKYNSGGDKWKFVYVKLHKIAYLHNWNISTFCFYSFQEFESAEELWLRGAIPRKLYEGEEFYMNFSSRKFL